MKKRGPQLNQGRYHQVIFIDETWLALTISNNYFEEKCSVLNILRFTK